MDYFKLGFAPEALGAVPQDKDIIGHYFVDAPTSFRHFANNDKIPTLWVPEGILLHYRAKLTDMLNLINVGFQYLIISESFLKLIKKYNLPKHQVFPINIVKREKKIQYYIFISKVEFAEFLDYDHSEFYILNYDTKEKHAIQIRNAEEFWSIYNGQIRPNYLRTSKYKIKEEAIKFDLFRLPRALGIIHYLVSSHIVNEIEKEGLTGLRFTAINGT